MWASWARSAAGTVFMAVAVWAVLALLPAPATWTGALHVLGASVVAGVAVVGGFAAALRMPELRWAVRAERG